MDNECIAMMTERIVRDFDPLQIILFGSQARAVWTSISTALTEHGYPVEKDL